MNQEEVANLIDVAVACWHEAADEHGIGHCNCFREKFARKLIDAGIFIGYDLLQSRDRRYVYSEFTQSAEFQAHEAVARRQD